MSSSSSSSMIIAGDRRRRFGALLRRIRFRLRLRRVQVVDNVVVVRVGFILVSFGRLAVHSVGALDLGVRIFAWQHQLKQNLLSFLFLKTEISHLIVQLALWSS